MPFLGIAIGKKAKEKQADKKLERTAQNEDRRSYRQTLNLALAEHGVAVPREFVQVATSLTPIATSLISAFRPHNENSSLTPLSMAEMADVVKQSTGENYEYSKQNNSRPFMYEPFSNKNLPYIIGAAMLFVLIIVLLIMKRK
ncbi:MAG: hypothetical protein WKF91_20820 [Segetibacter sp.]